MKDNPMQWSHTTPTISRLDYIATAIYAAMVTNFPNYDETLDMRSAISDAKLLISFLDKEQNNE